MSKLSELQSLIEGDVELSKETRQEYSHDTSLFEVVPQAVVFPKTIEDVQKLIEWVDANKTSDNELSLTARSGGTDMSGGAINDSIIVVFERYLNHIGSITDNQISAQPGAWYRDFEKITLDQDLIMPSYPASKELCAIGGMVANNAGGEKSLTYGKTEKFVKKLKVILADGKEYKVEPLNAEQLQSKLDQDNYEGEIYREIHQLITDNYELLKSAKPNVSKNSTGYKLWDVYDKDSGVFDLTQLFVGSQGTLGMITDTTFELVKQPGHSGVLVGYARDLDHMADLIHILRRHEPAAIEAFDEHTLWFAFRFFLQFRKGIGWWGLFKLALQLVPDALILMRGFPKMIFMASFESDDYSEIKDKLDALKEDVDAKHWHITTEEAENEVKAGRFWMMRRKSFKLLRDNVKGNLHTAPFIDDIVVPPDHLAEFWPKIKEIMDKYDLLYTIAGHLGDGNFHIIPLMDLTKESEREKIEPCLREVIYLVKSYDGVISGEHNDGLVRGPFLEKMYGSEVYELFKKTKKIFDPKNIFNPHKKTDADWEFSKRHIRDHF